MGKRGSGALQRRLNQVIHISVLDLTLSHEHAERKALTY